MQHQPEPVVIWLLIAWSGVAAFAAVAVGRSLRHRDRGAAEVAERGDAPALPAFAELACQESQPRPEEMAVLDRVIGVLERQEPRLAKVALLCWIGGLSSGRAAQVLAVTPEVVDGDLAAARAVLRRAHRV